MAAPAPLAFPDADPDFAELLAGRPQLSVDPLAGLMLEEVPLARIAAEVGTPSWVYSAGTLRRRARVLDAALAKAGLAHSLHFAVKANTSLAVLKVLAAEGMGADVTSGGELMAARAAGIPASAVVFSGVGKTAAELRLALDDDILQINLESAEEAEILSSLAAGLGKTARVALRVNPDVDAKTHAKITTGLTENKFGVPLDEAVDLYRRLANMPGLQPVVIDHPISSITDAEMQARMAQVVAQAQQVWLGTVAA
jgi:diaminopimelate decarboxylase